MSGGEHQNDMRKKLLDFIAECTAKNEAFLFDKAFSVYCDAVDFVSESVNVWIEAPAYIKNAAGYRAHTLAFFLYHTLVQLTNGMLTNLFTGNLPVCFMQFRLIIESLSNCWYADKHYYQLGSFEERLETLQKSRIRTTDILVEIESEMESGSLQLVDFWKRLSTDWVHAPRHAERFAKTIERSGMPPSWTLAIPAQYSDQDLPFLEELAKDIAQMKRILRHVVVHWPDAHG